uniref:hypothetical protein n=1 Tax=Pseudomonas syringae TaxID=317 RepID=UPI001E5304C0|nr:hypothetical protein [Pseudomonas syringae]
MKPIFQTKMFKYGQRGNCMRAALASIFEIGIDEIPSFEEMARGEWGDAFKQWLFEIGYTLVDTKADPRLDDFYLAIGSAGEKDTTHCVVYYNGELAHDPYPAAELVNGSSGGIRDARRFWYFLPLPE